MRFEFNTPTEEQVDEAIGVFKLSLEKFAEYASPNGDGSSAAAGAVMCLLFQFAEAFFPGGEAGIEKELNKDLGANLLDLFPPQTIAFLVTHLGGGPKLDNLVEADINLSEKSKRYQRKSVLFNEEDDDAADDESEESEPEEFYPPGRKYMNTKPPGVGIPEAAFNSNDEDSEDDDEEFLGKEEESEPEDDGRQDSSSDEEGENESEQSEYDSDSDDEDEMVPPLPRVKGKVKKHISKRRKVS
ncbi:hypothetical protein THAOC_00999 [Thalassiosira oceanica]|uniref:Uncharacterized protein n=1 Tax=Thalassiosira oceanica TaxID=159749 RepID=K0TNK0_THAOC|nr:hypothetical protein THAOC_00999 [Thalassiosira oceanica]|eukprot:EJK77186.1 hypothetical protein THAOC_00999 [Thalassiosira oceanica]